MRTNITNTNSTNSRTITNRTLESEYQRLEELFGTTIKEMLLTTDREMSLNEILKVLNDKGILGNVSQLTNPNIPIDVKKMLVSESIIVDGILVDKVSKRCLEHLFGDDLFV